MEETIFEKASETFLILGNITRLKILYFLMNKQVSVNEISNALNISQSNISHQLKYLFMSNLVAYKKEGKKVYYTTSDSHVESLLKVVFEHVGEKDENNN
ncbi:MAG: metalloregulator ArsR/SmtB family transcription factor [Acholeplasmatales bacterium]|jgi:ArsR family transcriptional regulator|nr:metalloregulator ArsR/SmtB family transcription factor [Acholeplasmatales bacterium]